MTKPKSKAKPLPPIDVEPYYTALMAKHNWPPGFPAGGYLTDKEATALRVSALTSKQATKQVEAGKGHGSRELGLKTWCEPVGKLERNNARRA